MPIGIGYGNIINIIKLHYQDMGRTYDERYTSLQISSSGWVLGLVGEQKHREQL